MSFNKSIKLGVPLSFLLSFLLNSVNAYADVTNIRNSGDWSLWESTTNQQTVCYIESSDKKYGFNPPPASTYIRISKVKNSLYSPVEIMVQLLDNPAKSTGMVANIRGTSQISFSDMNGGKTTFWGIPKNLSNFSQQISGGSSNIKIKGVGGKRDNEAAITINGYRDILSEMQNRCNSGAPLVSNEFEQEFLAQVPDSVDPTRIDANKTSGLRTAYHTAYKAFTDISAAKTELVQLLSKYQALIDELKMNRTSADQIQNTHLPQAQSELNNALTRQADARAELAKIEALIPDLSAKIVKSQKILDAASAVIAPLQPEHDRIAQNLSGAQNVLADSQRRLNYIETRLRNGAQQLTSIRSEADSIERYLPQKRSDLDRALYVYREAQTRRSQYNMSWERDNRLRNNFEYSRLHNDRNQMHRNLRNAEADTQRHRDESHRFAHELQMCRAQPIIAKNNAESVTENAEPRPPGPSTGDGGLDPVPNADCHQLEHALSESNSQLAQSEANQRNIANRINEINARISQIERQTDWDVRREYDLLVSREDQTRREYEKIVRDVQSDESRLSQIRNNEIPNLENEQRSLSSERPSVIERITQAQADVNRLSQELATFKSMNNWDQKVASVDSANRQLQNDQSQLDSVLSQKRLEQQKLEQNIAFAKQAQDRISLLTEQLTTLNNRAAELTEGLKNLPAERAPIDAKISALQTEITNQKTKFVGLLN